MVTGNVSMAPVRHRDWAATVHRSYLEGGLGDRPLAHPYGHGQVIRWPGGGGRRPFFVLSADRECRLPSAIFDPGLGNRSSTLSGTGRFLHDSIAALGAGHRPRAPSLTWAGRDGLIIRTLQGYDADTGGRVIAAVRRATPEPKPARLRPCRRARNGYSCRPVRFADHPEGGEGNRHACWGEDGNDTLAGGRASTCSTACDGDDDLRGNLNGYHRSTVAAWLRHHLRQLPGFDSPLWRAVSPTRFFGGNQDDQIWGECGRILLGGPIGTTRLLTVATGST